MKMILILRLRWYINHRIKDFCYCNDLILNTSTKTAENPLTGDKYYFYVIRFEVDAYRVAGLIVDNYIHLDALPSNEFIKSFLQTRIRRNFG